MKGFYNLLLSTTEWTRVWTFPHVSHSKVGFSFMAWVFICLLRLHFSCVMYGHFSQLKVVLKFLHLFRCMLLELWGITFSQLGQFHAKWLFLWFSSALKPTTIFSHFSHWRFLTSVWFLMCDFMNFVSKPQIVQMAMIRK